VHLDGRSDGSVGQGFVFQGHFSSFLASWIPDSEAPEIVTVGIGVAAGRPADDDLRIHID
jgi:hypothetical protein